jgi:predicted phage tail protein
MLHGVLKEKYGEFVEFNSTTVADALEGFSRQAKDFPRDLLIDVIGFDIEDKIYAPTDVAEVHLVPSMFGGGAVGKIIVGLILIAVAVLVPGLGTAFSAALLSAGIGLALGGVMQLFMKTPVAVKQIDASKYLSNSKNTVAIGTPITMAWGRVKLAGQWLSIQANSNKMAYGTFPATPT